MHLFSVTNTQGFNVTPHCNTTVPFYSSYFAQLHSLEHQLEIFKVLRLRNSSTFLSVLVAVIVAVVKRLFLPWLILEAILKLRSVIWFQFFPNQLYYYLFSFFFFPLSSESDTVETMPVFN